MPRLLTRSALFLAVPAAVALGVVGALVLRAPGLATVLVVAVLVGGTTAGIARETPGRGGGALDAGARAAGWTAGGLLVLAGVAALTGPVVTVLAAGLLLAGVVAVRLRRAGGVPGLDLRPLPPVPPRPGAVRADGPGLLVPEVGTMTTAALGDEWLGGTALLGSRLDPVVRRALVGRRGAVLDELERRDPAGFARWLADGPASGTNPADHVRDLPAGTGAA